MLSSKVMLLRNFVEQVPDEPVNEKPGGEAVLRIFSLLCLFGLRNLICCN